MDRRILLITMSFLACGMLPRAFAQGPPAIPTATAPDNTGINTRDRADNAMAASSQSGSKGDLALVARIRRAIVKDKSLSTMAHNVKIISRNGEVTLRGPVKSEQERTTVGPKAQTIAGTDRVDSRLEVAGQ
jgi:hyperosmotically inducible periplasmic protein